MNIAQNTNAAKCPFGAKTVELDTMEGVKTALRSRAAFGDADVSSNNYLDPTEVGTINSEEFLIGILPMINGDPHRARRGLLNALVRPDQLVRFREDVVLPSVDRWLGRALVRGEDGSFSCDLAPVVEKVFLEFAAKIIGLRDIESVERMERLQACALPIFAGMSSGHFQDRERIIREAISAKEIFLREFYRPSFEAMRGDLDRVARGEMAEEDIPRNLLQMVATGANENYADEDLAVKEAILFFVASTGTSAQAVLNTIADLSNWFTAHPKDRELIDSMEFMSNALQETLRLKGPFVPYITRVASDEIPGPNGCPINAGDEIHAMLPTAGRDKTVFGEDADVFNPHRPKPDGYDRYGFSFGAGAHQCMGLRVVLGNDGKSGSHIHLLQRLFQADVKLDPRQTPQLLAMRGADNIPTYISFPIILSDWSAGR
ncbi:cytochrome P450 (plasmid) [Sphingobium sp. SJ10-10]|uniref:cytochrome P450 n=1 Tax=unclassified Sphingobium TaxID=2611147 RepID=UPI000770274E|nr:MULTISPECIES: cytochrome P450 [unclassified Sphingobium]AMK26540.1 cytochrome P450 [Sphingobium sp. TKS]MEC6699565.1 cytochrome P450 [Sphingobium sp. SJ10-10]